VGGLRRAEFLHLACRDFWDVGICVDYLLDAASSATQLDARVRLVLETGMLITYARPFSGGSGRTISAASELSQALKEFHEDILHRRNKVYAHTDHTDIRQILDLRSNDAVAALVAGNDDTPVREEWDSLSDDGLYYLGQLSRIHYTQTHAEVDRLRVRLGSTEHP
jgi:hypothetical protein